MSRRDKIKYKNVNPSYNLKSRHDDILDVLEYWDQLNEQEKEWMDKFMAEYNNNDFRHDNHLHNTVELKRKCRKRNNDKYYDIYTKEKAKGRLAELEEYAEADYDSLSYLNGNDFNDSQLDDIIEKNTNDLHKE